MTKHSKKTKSGAGNSDEEREKKKSYHEWVHYLLVVFSPLPIPCQPKMEAWPCCIQGPTRSRCGCYTGGTIGKMWDPRMKGEQGLDGGGLRGLEPHPT